MNNSYENSVYMGMMQNSLQRKKNDFRNHFREYQRTGKSAEKGTFRRTTFYGNSG